MTGPQVYRHSDHLSEVLTINDSQQATQLGHVFSITPWLIS